MEEYFSAIRKMEQAVMFPSLLRGVYMEQQDDASTGDFGNRDLYEYYMQLKSIKLAVEGRLAPLNESKHQITSREEVQENGEEADLEGLLYHHFTGLYRVLTHLTRKANALIRKYNEIIGQINQSEITLTW
ncbi:thyroid hormone-inducible hepatic protein [Trachemys scripta elegans]|uniref:Thyroid hormone responsive n=1 Tax=Chrysemys picta bellii TaxID=8478 RepID=A0A8C3J171_CHRPI|nr:thyroid hormone-inducible hepatic protein [Chrysemys picta bellii]XP_034614984.1 thyroid hormone-inducible hepatic protein [Trachemys scripta elegans]